MAASETAERSRTTMPSGIARRTQDETKLSLKTTEFWAMLGIIVAILIATAISDSLNDVRAWTLVAAVAIGYMVSRGLAKSGTKYAGAEDPFNGQKDVHQEIQDLHKAIEVQAAGRTRSN
jgi:hypothetical protein